MIQWSQKYSQFFYLCCVHAFCIITFVVLLIKNVEELIRVSVLNQGFKNHCVIPLSLKLCCRHVKESWLVFWRMRPTAEKSMFSSWGHPVPAYSQITSNHVRETSQHYQRICAWPIESDKGSQRVPPQCQRKAGLGSLLSRGSYFFWPTACSCFHFDFRHIHAHLMHWLYTFTIYTGGYCELYNVFFSHFRQAVNSWRTWCFKQRSVCPYYLVKGKKERKRKVRQEERKGRQEAMRERKENG